MLGANLFFAFNQEFPICVQLYLTWMTYHQAPLSTVLFWNILQNSWKGIKMD